MNASEGRFEVAAVTGVLPGCQEHPSGSPPDALPELVERSARRRLLDLVPHHAPSG